MPTLLKWGDQIWEHRPKTGTHAHSNFALRPPSVLYRTYYGGANEQGGPTPGENWEGPTMYRTYYADGKMTGGGHPPPSHPIQSRMEYTDDNIPQEPLFERVRRNAEGLIQHQVHRNSDIPQTDGDRYAHPVHTLGSWETVGRYTVGSVDGMADVLPDPSMYTKIVEFKKNLGDAVSANAFRPLPMPTTSWQYQRIGNDILSTSRASNGHARFDTM
jgi:hypothetical protein